MDSKNSEAEKSGTGPGLWFIPAKTEKEKLNQGRPGERKQKADLAILELFSDASEKCDQVTQQNQG